MFCKPRSGRPIQEYRAGLPNVRTYESALTDLSETGALAMQMNRIVTVCTSIAHLSGALALPTWLLLSSRAHWLWLVGRTDTPWYPTRRLFRQQSDGDWGRVIAEIAVVSVNLCKFGAADAE